MSLQLLKESTSDTLSLNGISKRAFDSDVLIGAGSPGGPPGCMSLQFHTKMARQGHLYKLTDLDKWGGLECTRYHLQKQANSI